MKNRRNGHQNACAMTNPQFELQKLPNFMKRNKLKEIQKGDEQNKLKEGNVKVGKNVDNNSHNIILDTIQSILKNSELVRPFICASNI